MVMMSSHGISLLLFGRRAHAVAIGFQREQHGPRCQMHMVVAVVGVPAMAVVMIVIVVMMTAMMVVAMVPAVMAATVVLRLAFIQLKRLAHTDVVFAHV
jgi:hypothetical protein